MSSGTDGSLVSACVYTHRPTLLLLRVPFQQLLHSCSAWTQRGRTHSEACSPARVGPAVCTDLHFFNTGVHIWPSRVYCSASQSQSTWDLQVGFSGKIKAGATLRPRHVALGTAQWLLRAPPGHSGLCGEGKRSPRPKPHPSPSSFSEQRPVSSGWAAAPSRGCVSQAPCCSVTRTDLMGPHRSDRTEVTVLPLRGSSQTKQLSPAPLSSTCGPEQ